VKGPAAATLYGTEAANGVIRITTKRGRAGDTRWNFWVESGVVQEKNTYPLNFSGLDANSSRYGTSCELLRVASGLCSQTGIESYQVLHDPAATPFDDGSRQQYGASITGGSERVNYYISAEWEDETGPFTLPQADRDDLTERGIPITEDRERPSGIERANLRINLNSQVAEKVTMALRIGYLTSHLATLGNDNNSFGFLPSAFFGGSNPDDPWGFQAPAQLFGRDAYQDIQRFTSSLTSTWQPSDWLAMRGTVGLDYTNRHDVSFFARDLGVPGQRNLGRKDSDYRNTWQYTVDVSGTASFDLTDQVSSKTSVGVQYFRNLFTGTDSWGIDIVNGASSIGAAAETFSSEFQTEDKTAGIFIDQQFGINDRLFVGGAIRADDNSAFGQDFDLIYYPKANISWIASEEDFFPEIGFLDQLRVRGAWGRSGLQPGSDDAIRTLSADAVTSPDDETISGVSIGSLGNNLLEPERSSEIEFGLDADMFAGRVGLELTYYDKTTEGALIQKPLPPSLGASATRWVNIGEVENKGWEAAINAAILEMDNVGLSITLSGSVNKNELIDLGDNTEPIGSQTRFVPGFPLGGQWARPIQSYADGNGNGIIEVDELVIGDTIEFQGAGMPEKELSLSGMLTLFDNLRIYALFDYRGDYVAYNNTERFRCRFRLCGAIIDPNTPLDDQARATASLFHPSQTVVGYMEDADFIKFRELSVSYSLPASLTDRLRTSRASITVTGRNLATWTDYSGMDPEINSAGAGDNFGISEFLTQPPLRYWTVRFSFGF
jgi:outer membrane receptor protein involved in Fe transport